MVTNDEQTAMNSDQRDSLFDTLKQALKARGISYRLLAKNLGVSEMTVKRLFADRDCKLSRLLQLCQAAGISLAELSDMQQRRRKEARFLPLETEKRLAQSPELFNFLLLLISRFDTDGMAKQMGMDEPTHYRYLRSLEKMGILRIGRGNQYEYLVSLPIRWRLDGPLASVIIPANMQFVKTALEQGANGQYSIGMGSRLMSAQSAEKIKQGLQELKQQFEYLATQDQLFLQVIRTRVA